MVVPIHIHLVVVPIHARDIAIGIAGAHFSACFPATVLFFEAPHSANPHKKQARGFFFLRQTAVYALRIPAYEPH